MEKKMKRIGVLTSGGDAPGMNAAVRAVVRACVDRNIECIGIRRGWAGLINGDIVRMNQEKYLRILKDGYVSMDMAQNILVVKTVSGMAMAVAAALDAMNWSEVAGCIAGDDTIMCAIRTVEDTMIVMEKIHKIVGR